MSASKLSEVRAGDAEQDDVALVNALKEGDRRAFRLLFDRYHRRVYAVALGVVRDPVEATDIAQDAFVKVHKNIDRFEGNSAFYTWLYRITMNLSIDRLRRKKVTLLSLDEHRTEAPEGAHPAPLNAALRGELGTQLNKALDGLPEHHRSVFVLREVEGLSYEDIAETLEIPKGTVMSRLFHARRKMQTALEPYLAAKVSTPAPQMSAEGGL